MTRIEPRITIELDGQEDGYLPGGQMSGRYKVEGPQPDDLRAVELSVLWYTQGQGEEDLAIHQFDRWEIAAEGDQEDPNTVSIATQQFQCGLPNSPLSYDGVLIKICWCVRARAFLARGRELVTEMPFRLGNVPAARIVAPSPAARDPGTTPGETAQDEAADGP